jgi:spore maturation protein CgeB
MKLVIFGLTVSSSWGNGHATIWRGLCSALARAGHDVVFFEQDVSYYAAHRDLQRAATYELVLYTEWDLIRQRAWEEITSADSAIVTSYCPDAVTAAELILNSAVPVRVFYDLDTPVTLKRLRNGEKVDYVPPFGLEPFDLVLSYTGGRALDELRKSLGARNVAPLYGSVDPDLHQPVPENPHYSSHLSYLGTYAPDRQAALEQLFLEPARQSPEKKFLIGGALYPAEFPWSNNVWFVRHVPPPEHPAFYCSSNLTLSVTRSAMAGMGYCPSGRLFEAAACRTPVISDYWEGLESFFEPGKEILIASHSSDITEAISLSRKELDQIACAARERVLCEHTAEHRSQELLRLLEAAA